MKKTILLLSSVLMLLAVSCRKENPVPASGLYETGSGSNTTSRKVKSFNGMLQFADMAAFRAIYENLESRYDSLDETALEQFEAGFQYTSLRLKINQLREPWLSTDELNENLDPANDYVNGQVLQTLLNDKSALQIGKSIFVILKGFDVVEITDGNYETFLSVLTGVKKGDNITFHGNNSTVGSAAYLSNAGSSCSRKGKGESSSIYNSGNRKIVTKIWVLNLPFFAQAGGESDHFKKKRKGRWSKEKASSLSVGLAGWLADRNCENQGYVDTVKTQSNKKSISLTYTYWGIVAQYLKGNFGGSGQAKDDGGSGTTSVILN